MSARLDPFVDVLLREQGDQLYLLPDEPVTIVKGGKPRKVSKQPLTDTHIYAMLTEVAPSDAADKIDQHAETEFEYAADRGLVRVRIVPETGRLTAVITPTRRDPEAGIITAKTPALKLGPAPTGRRSVQTPMPPATPSMPAPKPPRPSAIAAAPLVPEPVPDLPPEPAAALPGEFADAQFQAAETKLKEMLKTLVASGSSDLHLGVGESPIFRTQGKITRQKGPPVTAEGLTLMLLAIMPERNRGEWKETGDTDFAYELAGLARFRVNAGRDRKGPIAVFRVIPAKVVTVEEMGIAKEIQALCSLQKGLVLVTGPTGSGKSTTLCALIDLINRTRSDHIITIEDPIEFVHENKQCLITQRQVHVHTDSFKTALRAALREDMIRTRYQPILRIDDLCPVGIEVLARMHHPELGIVSPDHFVPHFEASGLARRLTETILARAMPEIADIVRQTGLLISLNLPLPAFLDMETPAMLNGLCTRIGIPHARVLVELTESFPVEDMPGLRVAAERWRAQGYGTALDDVGPLVPRWRELIELPFTVLKLDLSMTRPSQHAAATEIIAASRARGLTVVAEGVSDEANLRRLQALGAQAVQSFLLARPMPARALPLWLRMVHASGHAGLLPGKTPSAGRQET